MNDLRSRERWRFPYPSRIGGQGGRDEAAVERERHVVALSFSDPAYEFSATQVTDVWLLDPVTRRLTHLPDVPAAVSLKFTSMEWASDGRLVMLAESGGRNVVAVWRPGQKRISVRPVRFPTRKTAAMPSWSGEPPVNDCPVGTEPDFGRRWAQLRVAQTGVSSSRLL